MTVLVQQLSVRLGAHMVLRGINLQLHPGRVLGLVGPNGSGKSTLIKAIAGLIAPEGGQVLFDGCPARPRSIAYMPQDLTAPVALKVLEVVLLGRLGQLRLRVSPQDLSAVREVLCALGIEALADCYLSELSGGQRQMVFLAQALVSEPSVLLLDEPTSALDISHQIDVLELVRTQTRRLHLSTVVVLHDLNAAVRFTDDVALIHQGTVCASGVAGAVLNEDNLGRVFNVQMDLLEDRAGLPVLVAQAPSGMNRLAAEPCPASA
ncbi:MAG: ABC transporter ATP-binding protein [Rhodoferax sp.]|nr:MAG: ABC transporter ATP-binding protein [Rhodoferax sp.]